MTQNPAMGAYGHQHHDEPGAVAQVATNVLRLLLPVIAYVVTLAAAWAWRAMPATWFDGLAAGVTPSQWLTQGHVLVAAAFFLNNLVSRRYGMDLAVWHVLASWVVLGLVVLAGLAGVDPRLPAIDLPPAIEAVAFAGGLIVAHIVAAFVFDRTRGVHWWTAPFYSALIGGLVFVGIFYGVVQPGGADWTVRALIDAGVKAAMAVAMLIPYFLLRPVVRPMPGFGGF
jgi:queuosine precursor transporter